MQSDTKLGSLENLERLHQKLDKNQKIDNHETFTKITI